MYQRNNVWWMRVYTPAGASRRVSLETTDTATAEKVEAWAADVRDRLDRHGVLEAVIAGEVSMAQAFRLGEVACARMLEEARKIAADKSIDEALLGRWKQYVMSEQGVSARQAEDYERQVAALIPKPRMLSWLEDPARIIEALDNLVVQPQTKGRYRSALASFCAFLVRKRLLAFNPMPSVPGYMQSKARDVWYSREDALKVLHAVPQPFRAAEAVMWACGWEFSAIANARVEDFNLENLTAYARGTKTDWRTRRTVITEPVIIPWLREVLTGKLPSAKVWPNLTADRAVKVHQKAVKAVGLPMSTNHDWRHSFAVKELKAGRPVQFVSQMLGHADTVMVQRVYGRYVLASNELESIASQIRAQYVAPHSDAAGVTKLSHSHL